MHECEQLSLRPCPRTRQLHQYDGLRRCIQCQAQMCTRCENCLLDPIDCYQALEDPRNLRLERKQSLAAKRVAGACSKPECQEPFELEHPCRCVDYIYSSNHRHELGEFHLCNYCTGPFEKLSENNTTNIHTVQTPAGPVKVEVYTCKCGDPIDVAKSLGCKVCWGRAKFPKLNENTWMNDLEMLPYH
ncbi:hypothetical protein BDZ45DRAFT_363189 [Acephala macrosclerotiorum]|nr:hypothetical protein BDZ45DRAFT_363189 [Acephala macrosclerotiorum]